MLQYQELLLNSRQLRLLSSTAQVEDVSQVFNLLPQFVDQFGVLGRNRVGLDFCPDVPCTFHKFKR